MSFTDDRIHSEQIAKTFLSNLEIVLYNKELAKLKKETFKEKCSNDF